MIGMPEQPANLVWGDHDCRTLYIAATTSVYRLPTKARGFVPHHAALIMKPGISGNVYRSCECRERLFQVGVSLMPLARQRLGFCCLPALFACLCVLTPRKAAAYLPEQGTEVEDRVARGFEFARAGELQRAEAELRQAAKVAPTNPDVLAGLGTILAQQGKLEESTTLFRRVLQIRPQEMMIRRYLAANLWQLHRYSEAKENLKVILRQQPNDRPSRLLLGMVSENVGDYVTATRMLGSVPDELRKQPESIAALARSYYHLRQIDKARAALEQLTAPQAGPQAVLLGAQIADQMQDYQIAEELLASIRSTFPDRPRLEYNLALVEYHAGEFAQSQQLLEALINSGSKNAALFNLLGWCQHKQGRPKEAVKALEESIQMAPSEETNYLDLGKILLAQHSLPRALQLARKTTSSFPNSAEALELQGLVETGMGQFTDAVRSYIRAAQLDVTRPDSILGLAQAQSAAGMNKDAAASFESGMRRFPKDARFKTQYAAALLWQSETGEGNDQARAEQLLRSALVLDPSLPEAHYQLGNLALKKGLITEAQRHLEQAVKLDAHNGQAHFALSRVYRRLGRQEEAARELERYESLKPAQSQDDNASQTHVDSRE
jgi:tetratricopeptide (TPR) repeat protein